eukprot:2063885-Pyramimonas_sp.AAC.1
MLIPYPSKPDVLLLLLLACSNCRANPSGSDGYRCRSGLPLPLRPKTVLRLTPETMLRDRPLRPPPPPSVRLDRRLGGQRGERQQVGFPRLDTLGATGAEVMGGMERPALLGLERWEEGVIVERARPLRGTRLEEGRRRRRSVREGGQRSGYGRMEGGYGPARGARALPARDTPHANTHTHTSEWRLVREYHRLGS